MAIQFKKKNGTYIISDNATEIIDDQGNDVKIVKYNNTTVWAKPSTLTLNRGSYTGYIDFSLTRNTTIEPTASTGDITSNNTVYYNDNVTLSKITGSTYASDPAPYFAYQLTVVDDGSTSTYTESSWPTAAFTLKGNFRATLVPYGIIETNTGSDFLSYFSYPTYPNGSTSSYRCPVGNAFNISITCTTTGYYPRFQAKVVDASMTYNTTPGTYGAVYTLSTAMLKGSHYLSGTSGSLLNPSWGITATETARLSGTASFAGGDPTRVSNYTISVYNPNYFDITYSQSEIYMENQIQQLRFYFPAVTLKARTTTNMTANTRGQGAGGGYLLVYMPGYAVGRGGNTYTVNATTSASSSATTISFS